MRDVDFGCSSGFFDGGWKKPYYQMCTIFFKNCDAQSIAARFAHFRRSSEILSNITFQIFQGFHGTLFRYKGNKTQNDLFFSY